MNKLLLTFLTIGILLGLLVVSAAPVAAATSSSPQVQTLFAGQDINVGTVKAWHDADNLVVKYETTGGWELQETHLEVATSLNEIPQTKKNNPIPGQFSLGSVHNPTVTTATYTIPLSEFSGALDLKIAAYAAVCRLGIAEGAWASGTQFAGANWATYFNYVTRDLSPAEACAVIQANVGNPDFHILDVRWNISSGVLHDSVNLSFRTLPYTSGPPEIAEGFTNAVNLLDKDDIYLVYCQTGVTSTKAVAIMRGIGFTQVYNMTGGYNAWKAWMDAGHTCPY